MKMGYIIDAAWKNFESVDIQKMECLCMLGEKETWLDNYADTPYTKTWMINKR